MGAGALTTPVLKHKDRWWLLAGLALAFALRVYALAGQSLWNDEGTSVALSALSPDAIIVGAARDIHPPLYYLLLHFWMLVAGRTEFAVRFLSVAAGVLIVALAYRFVRVFFSESVGIIAALLCALAPFQIAYSQETRMYIWVTLFGAVAAVGMASALKLESRNTAAAPLRREREPLGDEIETSARRLESGAMRYVFWFVYIDATIAALYTHYLAASLLLFENVVFAFWLLVIGRKRSGVARTLAAWVASQVFIGLTFVPWFLYTRGQLSAWPAISEGFDFPTLVWRALNVFSVGKTLDPTSAIALVVVGVLTLLALVGLWPHRQAWPDLGAVALLVWALAPLVVVFVISLSRPAYDAKFLLLAAPPFLILAARGLARVHPGVWVRRQYPTAALGRAEYIYLSVAVLAAVGFMPALRNYYSDPRYARDDYRAILEYIDANQRPGDGILVDAMGQIDVVRYYHHGDQALYLLPRMRPADVQTTQADVDDMLSKVGRLYAIYWATAQSDPQGIVESRLAQKAYKAQDRWYGDVRLAIYGVAASSNGTGQKSGARIGNEITLESFRVENDVARRGDIVLLSLDWRADQTPAGRYKVFVHLLNSTGQVVAQRDGEPVGDTRITPTWRAGDELEDHYGVLIPAELPPGKYQMEVGMYRVDDGDRLAIAAANGASLGDHLILGTVRVVE